MTISLAIKTCDAEYNNMLRITMMSVVWIIVSMLSVDMPKDIELRLIMLNVVMLSVILQSVIMLSVVMLGVIVVNAAFLFFETSKLWALIMYIL